MAVMKMADKLAYCIASAVDDLSVYFDTESVHINAFADDDGALYGTVVLLPPRGGDEDDEREEGVPEDGEER